MEYTIGIKIPADTGQRSGRESFRGLLGSWLTLHEKKKKKELYSSEVSCFISSHYSESAKPKPHLFTETNMELHLQSGQLPFSALLSPSVFSTHIGNVEWRSSRPCVQVWANYRDSHQCWAAFLLRAQSTQTSRGSTWVNPVPLTSLRNEHTWEMQHCWFGRSAIKDKTELKLCSLGLDVKITRYYSAA